MTFVTQWKERQRVPEVLNTDKIVETAGYIPGNDRIKALINAGVRLREFRTEQFSHKETDDVSDVQLDPTLRNGFDLADATAMQQEIKYKAEETKKAIEAEKKRKEVEDRERETKNTSLGTVEEDSPRDS